MYKRFMNFKQKQISGADLASTVKRNVIMSIGVKSISILVSLLIVPVTLGYLAEEEYGIWLTLSSMLAWIGFFDIGLTSGLRNKLTEALTVGDNDRAKIYLSTTLFLLATLMLVLLTIMGVCYNLIDWQAVFNSRSIPLETLGKVAFYTIAFFCIQFVLKIVTTLFFAVQRAAMADFLNMLGSLGALILIWLLTMITPKGSLLAVALVFSVVPVLVFAIANIVVFRGKYRNISPSIEYIKFGYTKELIGLGVKFFIVQSAALVLFTTSNFIITQLFGPSEVTIYNIAFKYFSVVTMGFTILMAPMWNAYTAAYVKEDYDWMRKAFHKTQLIWGIATLGSVLMLVLSGWVYELWVGTKVANQIPVSLSIGCMLFVTVSNWNNATAMLLNGSGKIKLQLIGCGVIVVLYVPLAVIMSKLLGITGVLYALCLTLLIGAVLQPIQCYKIINRKAKGIWNK